ncbi:MAG: hypothetical protein HOB60_08075, partial [Methylococcales bacterium]|nr:hypothetical protein [Methylococcales bacterium]
MDKSINNFLKVTAHKVTFVWLFVVIISGCSSSKVKLIVTPGANEKMILEELQADESYVQPRGVKVVPEVKLDVLSHESKVKKSTIANLNDMSDELQVNQAVIEELDPASQKPKTKETAVVERTVTSHEKKFKDATGVHLILEGTAIRIKEAVGVTLNLEGNFVKDKEVLAIG